MPDDEPIKYVIPENASDMSKLSPIRMMPMMPMILMPGSEITISKGGPSIFADPPVPALRSSADATGRILSLLSSTFAKMSLAVRDCIGRGRELQEGRREKEGLPKSAKVPYVPAPVSDVAQTTMILCVATISSLFGESPANYAMDKFVRATSTGDMRSFKIRLMFLKARDSLKGSPMYHDFVSGLEEAISESERMAGCKPDNSPRRLSKAEQERKRRIQERIEAKKKMQLELPLIWPSNGSSDQPAADQSSVPAVQDIERSRSAVASTGSGAEGVCRQVVDKCDTRDSGECAQTSNLQYVENIGFSQNSERDDETNKSSPIDEINGSSDIYCKKDKDKVKIYSKKSPQNGEPVRKARDYDAVEQILDDIESGAIVRYESIEEIKEDLKSGKLTPVEALMFTAAMDRYCESDVVGDSDIDGYDIDGEPQDEDGFDGEDEDIDDMDDGDDFEDYGRSRVGAGTSFSYNPYGFCGVGGRYSDSGDWDRDDAW